jgi:ABC-2 type transport system permease protein
LFLHTLKNEQRLYWRSRELAFFTFLFPLLIFVLLGSVYGNDILKKEHGIKASAYLLAGVLGYGLASTYAGLAIILVIRREEGILKRLRGTPLPAVTYLGSVIVSTAIVFAVESAVLIVLARVLFHPHLMTQWLSLVLALALGTVSFAALGIALASLIRSGDGASAVVNAVYLPMSFLAGSFWTPQQYPHFLKVIAELLPLTYFIRLMRDVTVRNETIWTDWKYAAAVGAWGLVGLVLAVRSFRWAPREG